MGLLHFPGWLCSTYRMGNTISRWMFLYQRSRSAVQKVHFRCSCGTSQHWYMLIFALNHNEHIAWGKDNFAFHLSWAVNSLFLLFRFGIFSYDVTTRLLSAMLWNILTPRAGPSLQPHHMLVNQCKQLENKLAAATCFKPLVHLLWNLASTFMSWLWKHWATRMVLSYNWKPPHHTSVPHNALLLRFQLVNCEDCCISLW